MKRNINISVESKKRIKHRKTIDDDRGDFH